MSRQPPRSTRHRVRRHPRMPERRPPERQPPDPLEEAFQVAGRGASTTAEFAQRPIPLPRALDSLRQRDFRLFWGSQVLSLVGTWMQTVAQIWLVLQLTSSPIALGIVNALQFLPILFFSVFGGIIADRLPKQRVLLATQSAGLALAVVLGYLAQSGLATLEVIMLIALLLGLVTAVDMPTRQAFVPELVRGQNLTNAIALNSAAFNGARLIGPAAAGVTIGLLGIPACFYINGASFIFPIIALLFIRAGRRTLERGVETTSVRDDLRDGFDYVRTTPLVRSVVIIVAIVGTFGMNLNVLVPLFAQNVLGVGADGYGYLTAATGIGALAAALVLAHYGERMRPSLLIGAAAALGLAQIILAGIHQYGLAAVVLGAVGFAMISFTTLANTTLQLEVPDALRGRVMSLYTTVFAGTAPIGALFAGYVAEQAGVGAAFLVGGLISVIVAGLARLLRGGRRG